MIDLRNATVLVVDDEPDLCDMLAFEFKLQGSTVCCAYNGQAAFEIARSRGVDVIVTDIRMANGNGIELLERVRTGSNDRPVIVFITAYEHVLAPWEAYDRGAEGLFGKPFQLKDLVDRVRRLLIAPSERWAEPPERQPRYRLDLCLPELGIARENHVLEIGRGGLALALPRQYAQVRSEETVEFDLTLDGGPLTHMEGAGYVHWVLHAHAIKAVCCGIEFVYLTDATRPAVVDWIADNDCRPFIPCFHTVAP